MIYWQYYIDTLGPLFFFLIAITFVYTLYLILWYAFAKIKVRDHKRALEMRKNPKPREQTALERVDIILQKRRDLR